ncbi:MAG: ribosome silencing factor [Phycisphaerales bacterium]|nr:ribosome silencing factor [Phycisphaerales bacterium]
MARSRSNADPELVEAFAVQAARSMRDDKCEDVVLLDVRGLSQVCDYVLIGSGTSQRQMKTVAQSVEDLGKERGEPPFRSTADTGTTWVVVDFVETVVHIFEPEHRMYYDIESLWGTARRVDWESSTSPDSDTE